MRKLLLWAGWVQPKARDIPGAEPFTPPAHWEFMWGHLCREFIVKELSPRHLDYTKVRFYTCDQLPAKLMNRYLRALNGPVYHSATNFAGIWLRADNSITIIRSALNDNVIVAHEMTHAIRGVGGHEPEWFNYGFGNFTGLQPEQL